MIRFWGEGVVEKRFLDCRPHHCSFRPVYSPASCAPADHGSNFLYSTNPLFILAKAKAGARTPRWCAPPRGRLRISVRRHPDCERWVAHTHRPTRIPILFFRIPAPRRGTVVCHPNALRSHVLRTLLRAAKSGSSGQAIYIFFPRDTISSRSHQFLRGSREGVCCNPVRIPRRRLAHAPCGRLCHVAIPASHPEIREDCCIFLRTFPSLRAYRAPPRPMGVSRGVHRLGPAVGCAVPARGVLLLDDCLYALRTLNLRRCDRRWTMRLFSRHASRCFALRCITRSPPLSVSCSKLKPS